MRSLFLLITLFLLSPEASQAQPPKKYALLAAVTKYEHAGMNVPQLEYPETDAKELGELLTSFGYDVDLLLGKQATQEAIRKKLEALNTKGEADGVALIGLFGHGVLVDAGSGSDPEGCFCPYDVPVRFVKDVNGTILPNDNGEPMTEPDPAKLIKVSEILLSLKIAKAGNRVVLADCCRKQPNQARGRNLGVGATFKVSDIPDNTAVLFGCSPNQQAFEHKDWGHGAFTRCLLDELNDLTRTGEDATTGVLADRLKKKVPKLVASKNQTDKQIPKPFSNDSIDLQLTLPISAKFEGTKAGERRELVPGIFFRWCPPGTFTMGKDDNKVSVTLTSGFWLGETEVTQGQWTKLMGTSPWNSKEYVIEGSDYAASYLSYDDAVSYCRKLTSQEQSAGRLPKGWKYSLPAEAQWEYACRAGTQTKYSFGGSESQLGEYGWSKENAWSIGEKFAHQVGKKKPNQWGLLDMHGNVWEWCSDLYEYKLPGGRDPVGASSSDSDRVNRGGSWLSPAYYNNAAARSRNSTDYGNSILGFRLFATDLVDLPLASLSPSRPNTIPTPSTNPLVPSHPTKPEPTPSRGVEGTKAGERKELVPTPTIAFRWCPAGTFTMGTPGATNNESPAEVTLTSGFWLGETEVTQGQWRKLMSTTPWQGKEYVKEGDDYAADYISHSDAVSYCQKLTTQEKSAGRLPNGWMYSLPTEAQWEYACRAGTHTKFSFGDSESQLSDYGWWGGMVDSGNAQSEQFAHQVGKRKPNAWELFDMHGNVTEWCSDWYAPKLSGGRNPVGPSTGNSRLFRGGGWNSGPDFCRSANRYSFAPSVGSFGWGFRLAAVCSSE